MKRADPVHPLGLERWGKGQAGKLSEQAYKEGIDIGAFFMFWYAKETDVVSPAPVLKVRDLHLQGPQLCVMFQYHPNVFFYSREALIKIHYSTPLEPEQAVTSLWSDRRQAASTDSVGFRRLFRAKKKPQW
ncbi:hypothetical protein NDU88_002888 [Pleurodeles waltl]|uniref:Uncharacterized protein n=1 Tax=Pleurodeles waltl TaxID=8319 RepID=A0AAV7WPX8_PLEWA|nr:hypothetical protein NDU88_002888 [Pleurodeles waltl]